MEGFFAQIPPGRERQKRLDRGYRQCNHIALDFAPLGLGLCRIDQEGRQPVQVVRAKRHRPVSLVLQDVLTKRSTQFGQPGHDLAQPILTR